MKKKKSIITIIILFFISLLIILFVFNKNIKTIKLRIKAKELIKYINNLDSDDYYYKNGVLYDSKANIVSTDYYLESEGFINKDKYNNIKMNLKMKDKCITKTSLGKVSISDTCNNSIINPSFTKNNSQISFKFNNIIYQYKISNKDNFVGEWITINDDNLVLNIKESDSYYIWFSDNKGNISDSINFTIDCILTDDSQYNKDTLYCIGSTIVIDDINFMVINQYSDIISLMMTSSLNTKLSHYEDDSNYKWSTSNINKYLNNEFINTFKTDLKNKLIDVDICDTPSGVEGCDSLDGCGGYKRKVIEDNNWECSEYTKSKIRIISYDEYASLYDSVPNNSILFDNYWTINSYKISNTGISILENGKVFVGENLNTKLNIKPVITISR